MSKPNRQLRRSVTEKEARRLARDIVIGWAQSCIDCGALDLNDPKCTLSRMLEADATLKDKIKVHDAVFALIRTLER